MTLPKTLLIIYYSNSGKTEKMAFEIAKGAEKTGVNVTLKKTEECTSADLIKADGLAVGTPTYYSNISWPMKKLLDEKILAFYAEGHSLRNKVCGCFTSTGAYNDGVECLRMLELAFGSALKMRMVSGIILESKDVDEANFAVCYNFGQKLAQELNFNRA